MPRVSLTAMLMLLTLPVTAHETWLLPDDFAVADGETVDLRMTSGMGFPGTDSAIDPSRLRTAVLLQDGRRTPLEPEGTGGGALLLQARAGASAACAAVELHPRVLAIEDQADVRHYLEEIGAPKPVWVAWEATAAREVWRESYSKLARSYLRGAAAAQPCWDSGGGMRFDILPASDPSALRPGASLALQLTLDGAPLAGQAVGVVREGDDPAPLRRSDAYGRLVIDIGGPGRYMVYATHVRPVQMQDANWESDFVTLTFEVLE